MNKRLTVSERLSKAEASIRKLRAEMRAVRRDVDERTRPASRIGFEVFPERDWDIGDEVEGSE